MQKSHLQKHNMISQINTEISISTKLKHENIIKVYDCFEDQEYIYLVLEYAENGQLYQKLKKVGRFSQNTVRAMIKDVIAAVQYLHSQNPPIVHRDIKPENLLLDKSNKVKLADFGWSTVLNKPRKTYCGTIDYLAPQMIDKSGHDQKLDIWCIGVLVYELLTGRTPFLGQANQGNSAQVVQRNILNMKIQFPNSFPTLAKDFVMGMIKRNPKQRMTYPQIRSHPWLTQTNTSSIQLPTPLEKSPVVPSTTAPNVVTEPGEQSQTIKQLTQRIKQLQEQLHLLKKSSNNSQSDQLQRLLKQNRALKLSSSLSQNYEATLQQLQDKYDRLQIQCKISKRKSQDLQNQIEKVQTQRDQLQEKCKRAMKQLTSQKQKVKRLEKQLSEATSGFLHRAKTGGKISKQQLQNPQFVQFLLQEMKQMSSLFQQSKDIVSKVFERQKTQFNQKQELSRLKTQEKNLRESIRAELRSAYENEKDQLVLKFRGEIEQEREKWCKEREQLKALYEQGNYTGNDGTLGHMNKETDLQGELKNVRELNSYYEKTISQMKLQIEDLREQVKRRK